jgi:hypothetical protein
MECIVVTIVFPSSGMSYSNGICILGFRKIDTRTPKFVKLKLQVET